MGAGALSVCTSQLLYSLITLKKLFFWAEALGASQGGFVGPHSSFLFLFPISTSFPLNFMALLIYLTPHSYSSYQGKGLPLFDPRRFSAV